MHDSRGLGRHTLPVVFECRSDSPKEFADQRECLLEVIGFIHELAYPPSDAEFMMSLCSAVSDHFSGVRMLVNQFMQRRLLAIIEQVHQLRCKRWRCETFG